MSRKKFFPKKKGYIRGEGSKKKEKEKEKEQSIICYKCKKPSHFKSNCPYSRKAQENLEKKQ